ncbi:hypothetical protein, partial [Cupriavidus sp. WS]|uniref:hypothetical protein n=1 Tax=Cupriavidus sp. WS TaxID=1312922 RepID=UPI001E5C7A7F
ICKRDRRGGGVGRLREQGRPAVEKCLPRYLGCPGTMPGAGRLVKRRQPRAGNRIVFSSAVFMFFFFRIPATIFLFSFSMRR